jgi:hypothetical protein
VHEAGREERDNVLEKKWPGIIEQHADKRKREIKYDIEGVCNPETA